MSSTLKKPLEETVKKILEDASLTGTVTKEQLVLILMYQQECKKDNNPIKDLLGNSDMILKFIEGIFK